MTAAAIDECPTCGDATEPRRTVDGHTHASLCLPCTEAEVGETYVEIRDRATANIQGRAKKKWRVTS